MIIGDVGQSTWEEIDWADGPTNAARDADFGWPGCEGPDGPCPDPVISKNHSDGWCAIVGGYVVRDPGLPTLTGRYIYGDLSKSGLRSLALGQPSASGDAAVAGSVSGLDSFGEDAAGCVYAVSVLGPVYRIAPDANPTPGPCPLAGDPPAAASLPLTLSARKGQHILRTRRLKIRVVTTTPSTIVARASITVSRRHNHVLKFRRITVRNAKAGKRTTLRLRLSRHNFRKLRRLLRHRGTMVAKVSVTISNGSASGSAVKAIRLLR
jgi:hypothetical protein